MSIGCNACCDVQMRRVRGILCRYFPDIAFTDVIVSAAYGQTSTAAPYANMMAVCTSAMPEDELVRLLKTVEEAAGNTSELRSRGVVMMDIDLMQYDGKLCHTDDWERPYVKKLYMLLKKMLCMCVMFAVCSMTFAQSSSATSKAGGSELLGKAVEYYMGAKYHECALAFEKLQKSYALTPRLQAYLGFSYYKEGRYSEAVENLQTAIPHLAAFSPKERSAYLYACAESLFELCRYVEADRYYDMLLPLTEGNDKGDVLFHKAFSIYLDKKIEQNKTDSMYVGKASTYVMESYNLFCSAANTYKENTSSATSVQVARLRQCEAIIKGFESTLLPFVQKNKS